MHERKKMGKYASREANLAAYTHSFVVAYSLKSDKGLVKRTPYCRSSRPSADDPNLTGRPGFAAGIWVDLIVDLNWEHLQNRVCRKCIDGDTRGGCRLPVDELCRLKEDFAEIVETVASVHSDALQDYVHALRSNICRTCEDQYADGTCWKRDALECALDRYFPIVVEIIESANAPDVGARNGPAMSH